MPKIEVIPIYSHEINTYLSSTPILTIKQFAELRNSSSQIGKISITDVTEKTHHMQIETSDNYTFDIEIYNYDKEPQI